MSEGWLYGGRGLIPEFLASGDAVCAQTDPDAFFPEKGGNGLDRLRRICATCQLQPECLQFAIDNDERYGLWGGLTPLERRELGKARPKRGRPPAQRCGTSGGARGHYRRGESPCAACRQAAASYRADLRARKAAPA